MPHAGICAGGAEQVRFVRNGNVIVLKGNIHEGTTAWGGFSGDEPLVVYNGCDEEKVAVITEDGDVYLKGAVTDGQSLTADSFRQVGLTVKNASDEVLSMIDGDGNLKASGEVIVQGVPYLLDRDHGDDPYSTYN